MRWKREKVKYKYQIDWQNGKAGCDEKLSKNFSNKFDLFVFYHPFLQCKWVCLSGNWISADEIILQSIEYDFGVGERSKSSITKSSSHTSYAKQNSSKTSTLQRAKKGG